MKTKTQKIAGVSFEEVTRALSQALTDAYPSSGDGACSPCSAWPTECYDDRVVFTKDDGVFEQPYTYANGVATLSGSPTPVVRQYVPAAGEAAQPPAAPAAPVTQSAKRGAPMKNVAKKGGGGASDIVQLAADRLSALAKDLKKSDGNITPEIKSALDAVSSLLDTATSLYSGGGAADAEPADDEPEEPAADAAPDASDMADLANAEKSGGVVMMTPPELLSYAVAQMKRISEEKDVAKRNVRKAQLEQMLKYTVTWSKQFAEAGLDMPSTLPVAMLTQDGPIEPTEVTVATTPMAPASLIAAAGGAAGIGGAKAPLVGDLKGTPQFTEKLAKVQEAIALLKGTAPVAKTETAPAEPVAKGVPGSHETGLWPASYVDALPDSSFLYVEESARKNDAGQTMPGFRHFPVLDAKGQLSKLQLSAAIDGIPRMGAEAKFKADLLARAKKMFGMSESIEKSLANAEARGDDGWPVDLAAPDYLRGRRPIKAAATFGLDNLVEKAAALETAAAAAAK